jgi:hypothetical protein
MQYFVGSSSSTYIISKSLCWILNKTLSALRNTQERKPVTNSRDTQELLPDAGNEMIRIFLTHEAKTSLLQDYAYYDVGNPFCAVRTVNDVAHVFARSSLCRRPTQHHQALTHLPKLTFLGRPSDCYNSDSNSNNISSHSTNINNLRLKAYPSLPPALTICTLSHRNSTSYSSKRNMLWRQSVIYKNN